MSWFDFVHLAVFPGRAAGAIETDRWLFALLLVAVIVLTGTLWLGQPSEQLVDQTSRLSQNQVPRQ